MHLSYACWALSPCSCCQVAWGEPKSTPKLSAFCLYFLPSALLMQQVLIWLMHCWAGRVALLRRAGHCQTRQTPQTEDTAFPGKHFFLTGRTPLCCSNKYSTSVLGKLLRVRFFPVSKEKILAFPVSLRTTSDIYSKFCLLSAYCEPGMLPRPVSQSWRAWKYKLEVEGWVPWAPPEAEVQRLGSWRERSGM